MGVERRMKSLTCKQPDRDCPKLLCGHPLPCPYHTVLLHLGKKPPTVEIPTTATEALVNRDKLAMIGEALVDEEPVK